MKRVRPLSCADAEPTDDNERNRMEIERKNLPIDSPDKEQYRNKKA
jgi:hypothetical protein